MQIGHSFIYVPSSEADAKLDAVTYIQYANLMKGASVLQGGDIARLHDGLTTVFYEASTFPKVIEVEFNAAKEINCFSVAGCNFKTANVSIWFEAFESGAYVTKGVMSNLKDNQPAMMCFELFSATKARVTITANAPIYIGEMAIAKALKMPVSPSVGYRPAKWNMDDEVTHHTTSAMNVGRSTINKKGSVEVLPFKLVNHEWMRGVWSEFIQSAKGAPIWVGWNQLNYNNECVFGSWKQDDVSYTSPLYSAITLTVTGVV